MLKPMTEFVFSAPSYAYIIPSGKLLSDKSLLKQISDIISEGVKDAKDLLKGVDYPLMVSLLFNAFTEKKFSPIIEGANGFGFDRVYTDSGGLQMVTRKLDADIKAKQETYRIQSRHDLTMCFDEIPLRNETGGRSSGNKVFLYDQLKRCAEETSRNVIDQIDAFTKLDSQTKETKETKVFFIVQGNTMNDMLEWFEIATKTIPEEYWKRICGVAVGGMCLGSRAERGR